MSQFPRYHLSRLSQSRLSIAIRQKPLRGRVVRNPLGQPLAGSHAPTAARAAVAARHLATVSDSSLSAFSVLRKSRRAETGKRASVARWECRGSGDTPGDARSRGANEIVDGL